MDQPQNRYGPNLMQRKQYFNIHKILYDSEINIHKKDYGLIYQLKPRGKTVG